MGTTIIGIGDFAATGIAGDTIRTLALGSCIAVTLLHPQTHTVGMVHVALPDSHIDREKAERKPGSFVDTGIPALVDAMKQRCGDGNIKKFIIKIAGGASVLDPNGIFNIGKNNVLAAKKLLWTCGVGAVAEDTGGHISRNVEVDVDTGSVVVSSAGRGSWML